MAQRLRLDSAGIAEVLRSSKVTAAVSGLARGVASNVGTETAGGDPIPVQVRERVAEGPRLSARPAFDVTLAHPAGLRVEAKRSTLLRAAQAEGLEVRGRGSLA